MKPQTFHLTADGLEELKKELNELETIKLPEAVERVRLAREQGDLAENSEYHAARDDHAFIQGRIDELNELISRAKIVKKTTNSVVSLGNKVTVTSNGKTHTYHVVGKYKADPATQTLSDASPLRRALMGTKVGQEVEYVAPVGKIIYRIEKIH